MDLYVKIIHILNFTVNFVHIFIVKVNLYFTFIAIDGYIKTPFVGVQSQFDDASYGCGSITDGFYKITVNIANFQPLNLRKGTAVHVIGETKSTSKLSLRFVNVIIIVIYC